MDWGSALQSRAQLLYGGCADLFRTAIRHRLADCRIPADEVEPGRGVSIRQDPEQAGIVRIGILEVHPDDEVKIIWYRHTHMLTPNERRKPGFRHVPALWIASR